MHFIIVKFFGTDDRFERLNDERSSILAENILKASDKIFVEMCIEFVVVDFQFLLAFVFELF